MLVNNTLNLTVFNFTKNFTNTCVLNQAALVESTTKIPKTGYYILVFGLLALVFYFIIQPRLKQSFQENMGNGIGYLGMCLVFLACWVLFLFVFQLSEEELVRVSKYAGWLVLPPLAIYLLVCVYKWYKRSGGINVG